MPTFVYWKRMINQSKSDGLFDMADIFPTALSLAGKPGAEAGKLVPASRYIDGIDQTSFLIGDKSQSNRCLILYFIDDRLSGVRVDEFRILVWVLDPHVLTSTGYFGGNTGSMAVKCLLSFNLYTNPQEDESVTIRHIPANVGDASELDRYAEVLKKFPISVQIKTY